MVKEQRGRISELSRGRQEIVGDYKVCQGILPFLPYPRGEHAIPISSEQEVVGEFKARSANPSHIYQSQG